MYLSCQTNIYYQTAFHDCVGPDGCDGCLNNDDPSNAGFTRIIENLSRHRSRGRQPFTVRKMQI